MAGDSPSSEGRFYELQGAFPDYVGQVQKNLLGLSPIRGCEMISINELGLGRRPNYKLAEESGELAQGLDDLVVTMKDAVAMDIWIESNCNRHSCYFTVSTYHPNKKSISAARKERLRLSAISMSSEQSQIATTGDSVWLGIEPYAALYTHGERREFEFKVDSQKITDSSVKTFATDLGLAIVRNAHLVECLRVHVATESRSVKTFLSLGAWKGAFPSLRGAYLSCDARYRWQFDLSPHLLEHVRGLEVIGKVKPAVLPYIESMIRNKDCGIEEVKFGSSLLKHATLLDDTLRRVRSFRVDYVSEDDVRLLTGSLERTKAHGDNLVRLRVHAFWHIGRRMATLEKLLRSRLQILNLGTVSFSTIVVLCPAFASSVLTTLKVGVPLDTAVEDKTLADGVGMLLQHPTIRDLDLTVLLDIAIRPTSQMEGDSVYHFERCVAEGLRATSLRRFHLTVEGAQVEMASVVALTKMYENARENWLESDGHPTQGRVLVPLEKKCKRYIGRDLPPPEISLEGIWFHFLTKPVLFSGVDAG